ncbi:MAG: FAD-dependent oxidoreductase [Candidatus Promineifilaceae bacterium]
MSSLPAQAKVVVIGAGIVGNSLVYHLAKLGWTDMVQIDKGPLPNPGGSTGHASNFIFPVDHSKEMCILTQESIATYKHFGTFVEPGGIELARTPERMQESARRVASAKAWGEQGEVISAEQIKEMAPFVNTENILGGFYSPTAGVCDPLRAGTLMREYAMEKNALQTFANVEVMDLIAKNGRIRTVVTDEGSIDAEYVIIACGVWAPRLARMVGVRIPLAPIVHQFMTVGPVPMFEGQKGEINYPMIRDVDENMYERQNGSDLEIGSYCHRTIIHEPDDIPSNAEATMTPTELPFTADDFDAGMEIAIELMPDILDNDEVGIRHAINGLMSLTPDGAPLIGEFPTVKGLWSCNAIWIKEAPGFGRATAELMTYGTSEVDITGSRLERFFDHNSTKPHVYARVYETFNKMYSIIHPAEQYSSNREVRLSPFHARTSELGAEYIETAGWERPLYYRSNEHLLEKYGDKVMPRSAEWDSRWWSPIINAEHLQMRETGGVVDLTAFAVFDITGSGVVAYMQKMTVHNANVKVGRSIYTPILDPHGGFKADLTIMRMGKYHYRVITGGGGANLDKSWFMDNMPDDGSVHLADMSSAMCTIGLWGPNARAALQSITEDDVSDAGIRYGSVKKIVIGTVTAWAFRISYVGEAGWEIYTHMEQGTKLYDVLLAAAKAHDMIPVGNGVYGTTARIEKGYRAMGAELESEYNPVEAGLSRGKVKKADFIGKEAYVKAMSETPAAMLCTLAVMDNTSSTGEKRYMLGREPILTKDGERIVDSHGRGSYVTSAGSAPSMGQHLLMSYLPTSLAQVGTELLVEYLGEQYPVQVVVAGATPYFDAADERMKG